MYADLSSFPTTVSLNFKQIKSMDALKLEMAYQCAFLDKKLHMASMVIAACYRGIVTRRRLKAVLARRKTAIFFI